jgi:CheY-like chemotaxis protein
MEAIGRLAGGIAHDFNNMLGVILGYADLALRRLSAADPLTKSLAGIKAAAERSADLTRQLLAFSRRQAIAPRVLDLDAQLRGMESLLRRIIGEDVELVFRLAHGGWLVSIDPSQLDQVLANLAVNARDAMPAGGRLVVATENVTLDEAYCRIHPEAVPGQYVCLSVSDDGCGMDAATLSRAFEPFFTTKPEGKGTGLGLAMLYGIVRQNGGHVSAYSEPGRGTTFRIYLPRHQGAAVSAEPAEPSARVRRGRETILLVEDEESLRELAQELLEELGYGVLPAAGPGEALTLCEKHAGAIDLLLTDVVMPVMGGKELADRITALRPGIKVLFSSGYTADAIAHQGVLEPGVHLLEKPFVLATLARKVAEALGTDRPPQVTDPAVS